MNLDNISDAELVRLAVSFYQDASTYLAVHAGLLDEIIARSKKDNGILKRYYGSGGK